jgi:hypothetical protein
MAASRAINEESQVISGLWLLLVKIIGWEKLQIMLVFRDVLSLNSVNSMVSVSAIFQPAIGRNRKSWAKWSNANFKKLNRANGESSSGRIGLLHSGDDIIDCHKGAGPGQLKLFAGHQLSQQYRGDFLLQCSGVLHTHRLQHLLRR